MLIIESGAKVFNTEEIHRGTLVCARHSTWDEEITGMVTSVTQDCVRVQFPPSVQNTLNHYFIYATEVANGEWDIKYSDDLETIKRDPEAEAGEDNGS